MRPIIGVSGKLVNHPNPGSPIGCFLAAGYTNGLAEAGGIPFIIPYLEKEEDVRDLAHRLDGLLLSGGVDITPTSFGEQPVPGLGEICPERDWIEAILFDEMQKQGKPVFGICRGMQVINVYLGGTLYQDLDSQKDGELVQHDQRAPHWYAAHHVTLTPDTTLHRLFEGRDRIGVNTFHHQAVRDLAPGLVATAVADDGVIEAYERKEGPYLLAVQWHPELMWHKDRSFLALFRSFVEACQQR
ncbi:gamma-glutamyl-gamma-aminobutyrate hydrolase family protein [Tumebacillus sp. ITR2]|uniref:Gamma-glutamyl-gamma-aminobutyrate hydrolase family protein n=1 Tax=Tumebacillus amylolyticus TaxID=2801339 RepID=A0ABS1JGB7_9BACL|nr:gamma-glutamyl-gamma-aminobutyrate hydrolase family protein [Tumebacillus amylolyticus]MBL0389332.1 gamma-glutamyl-gamma-aminobutyrate hydrolase family protein [Tumebacillus amylolyticus]